MRKSIIRKIAVNPIFSLDDKVLQNRISADVLQYKDNINASILDKYGSMCVGQRLISLGKIRPTAINSDFNSYPISRAFGAYEGKEELAQTPFLLGLAAKTEFLSEILDIQTIEVFELEQLFSGKFKRPSQLCLRRGELGWFVDISTYVHNKIINYHKRESPNSVNIICFVEKPYEEKSKKVEDLSTKMIG